MIAPVLVDGFFLPPDPWVSLMTGPGNFHSSSSRITSSILLAAALTDPRVTRFLADHPLHGEVVRITPPTFEKTARSHLGSRSRLTVEARVILETAERYRCGAQDIFLGPLDVLYSVPHSFAFRQALNPFWDVIAFVLKGGNSIEEVLKAYRKPISNQVRVIVRRRDS